MALRIADSRISNPQSGRERTRSSSTPVAPTSPFSGAHRPGPRAPGQRPHAREPAPTGREAGAGAGRAAPGGERGRGRAGPPPAEPEPTGRGGPGRSRSQSRATPDAARGRAGPTAGSQGGARHGPARGNARCANRTRGRVPDPRARGKPGQQSRSPRPGRAGTLPDAGDGRGRGIRGLPGRGRGLETHVERSGPEAPVRAGPEAESRSELQPGPPLGSGTERARSPALRPGYRAPGGLTSPTKGARLTPAWATRARSRPEGNRSARTRANQSQPRPGAGGARHGPAPGTARRAKRTRGPGPGWVRAKSASGGPR